MSILDDVKSVFGDATKWVLLGAIGFIALVTIVLLILFITYIKWILLGAGIALVLAIVGVIVYKKIKAKQAAATN